MTKLRALQGVVLAVGFLFVPAVRAQFGVFTYHNNNGRTGVNTREYVLTPENVNTTQFGKLFSRRVDGFVYAQPLYMPAMTIPHKGVHNVVFVATEHDSVYAFDAESHAGKNAFPLWHVSFINPKKGVNPVRSADLGCPDIVPEIGITGTPVIDEESNTLYVVSKTDENGKIVQRLHALDVNTGREKFDGPVVITATVPGTGDGNPEGMITFDPTWQNQRAGLLLDDGVIYIAWGSHCDSKTYHGWVMAYDAHHLDQLAAYATTPNGTWGGVWQASAGLAADSQGNLFFATGNGTFNGASGGRDYGDSMLRLSLSGGSLSLLDYFTPYNEAYLEAYDFDLGSGGVLLLPDQPGPHRHLLVQAGKEGTIYLVDRDKMGHFNSSNNNQIVQSLLFAVGGMWSVPAYWHGNVFFGGSGDVLKAFSLNHGLLSTLPFAQGSTIFGFPGATPSVSSNGTTDGIVWVTQTDAYIIGGTETLRAYEADNLFELYNSNQNFARDDPGGAVKFSVPTVAKGKVYVGAYRALSVYGLLHHEDRFSAAGRAP